MCVQGVVADCHHRAKHSLSLWQSDLQKQHNRTPPTECIQCILKSRVKKMGFRVPWRKGPVWNQDLDLYFLALVYFVFRIEGGFWNLVFPSEPWCLREGGVINRRDSATKPKWRRRAPSGNDPPGVTSRDIQ